MQIQLSLILLFFSSFSFAVSESDMKQLFKNYEKVMDEKKVELVDDVFSPKFIKESGGKKEFISKVKSLPSQKNAPELKVSSWRQGQDGNYFVKIAPAPASKKVEKGPEFIVIKENGKLKIDGTAGDEE